jgi:L-seryl-tRNA(Ser) seleniumtransferase
MKPLPLVLDGTQMKLNELLRQLPAVDEVLLDSRLTGLAAQSRARCLQWTRDAIDAVRERIRQGELMDVSNLLAAVVDDVQARSQADEISALRPVINATGVLLHTNLGRAVLSQSAIRAMDAATGYTNLELDLATGKRSKRAARVHESLAQLTGAEAAVVVNNCAAATVLVLQAVAAGREVIISRGQLVEIGGGFRLPEVFVAAGVQLHEVGTTNRTYLRDYENAINEDTGAMIRVHRSNFSQSGFVCEPTIQELVAAQRPPNVCAIDDLGSGWLGTEGLVEQFAWADGSDAGRAMSQEPGVLASVACGADLCLFSGDKLFGGPQAGIVVGKLKWIEMLRRSPLMRAMRPDKLTLAALEATVDSHLAGNAVRDLPLYQMLARSTDSIQERCQRIVAALQAECDFELVVAECESQIGGGSMPDVSIPSFGVRICCGSGEAVARQLRTGQFPVQCRREDGDLLLDLRTVSPTSDAQLAEALRDALI